MSQTPQRISKLAGICPGCTHFPWPGFYRLPFSLQLFFPCQLLPRPEGEAGGANCWSGSAVGKAQPSRGKPEYFKEMEQRERTWQVQRPHGKLPASSPYGCLFVMPFSCHVYHSLVCSSGLSLPLCLWLSSPWAPPDFCLVMAPLFLSISHHRLIYFLAVWMLQPILTLLLPNMLGLLIN